MSKHDLQIKEYPVTEDYPATTVAVCLNHDEASAYQRRRTADLETIAEDYGTYICCLDLGCEGEQDCEGNVLRAIGKAYDLGAASVDRKAIVEEAFEKGRASVVFNPHSHYRDKLREMICEGDFDFTNIFEEIEYEGETYADISNEGADALVDYFIDLMEQIDERRVIGFRGGSNDGRREDQL